MESKIILDFISVFNKDIVFISLFNSTASYWFAHVLKDRFNTTDARIYYNPDSEHFSILIENRMYDINGEISKEGYILWEEYLRTSHINTNDIIRKYVELV